MTALSAQSAPLEPLEFLGFRPGSPRAEVERVLSLQDGSWRCAASTVDPRFAECRGALVTAAGSRLTVIASLIGGQAAILLLSAPIPEAEASQWIADLGRRFGAVEPRRTQGLDTWQWVRQRRMIRVTIRRERGVPAISVSLVDGPLLDGLGQGAR